MTVACVVASFWFGLHFARIREVLRDFAAYVITHVLPVVTVINLEQHCHHHHHLRYLVSIQINQNPCDGDIIDLDADDSADSDPSDHEHDDDDDAESLFSAHTSDAGNSESDRF